MDTQLLKLKLTRKSGDEEMRNKQEMRSRVYKQWAEREKEKDREEEEGEERKGER